MQNDYAAPVIPCKALQYSELWRSSGVYRGHIRSTDRLPLTQVRADAGPLGACRRGLGPGRAADFDRTSVGRQAVTRVAPRVAFEQVDGVIDLSEPLRRSTRVIDLIDPRGEKPRPARASEVDGDCRLHRPHATPEQVGRDPHP